MLSKDQQTSPGHGDPDLGQSPSQEGKCKEIQSWFPSLGKEWRIVGRECCSYDPREWWKKKNHRLSSPQRGRGVGGEGECTSVFGRALRRLLGNDESSGLLLCRRNSSLYTGAAGPGQQARRPVATSAISSLFPSF